LSGAPSVRYRRAVVNARGHSEGAWEATDEARAAYYAGALLLLSFLESRRATGRRFGAEADARWAGLAGHLSVRDRIDVLVRDADLEWPGAIGARRVFGLEGVAEDDAFGPTWEAVPAHVAAELFRQHGGVALPSVAAWLEAAFAVARRPRAQLEVEAVAPNDRFVAAGASAVAALLSRFEGRRELDFGAQVLVVAEDPFARQLAAAAPLVLASGTATTLTGAPGDPALDARAWRGAGLFASPDASARELATANAIALGEARADGGA
jgi:hypothetical protein